MNTTAGHEVKKLNKTNKKEAQASFLFMVSVVGGRCVARYYIICELFWGATLKNAFAFFVLPRIT